MVWVTASLLKSLLSVWANLNNAIVCIVLILPLISNSSSLFTGVWELFLMCLQQLVSMSPSYLSFFFKSLWKVQIFVYLCNLLEQQSPRDVNFLLTYTRFGLLWSVCISKSQRIFVHSFLGKILFCAFSIW